MHILFEAIPVSQNRDCTSKPKRLYYYHGAGTRSLGTSFKRLYSCQAATISILLQPQNDPYRKY